MRDLNIEELKGLWRADSEDHVIDLYVRINKKTHLTVIDKKDNSNKLHMEGIAKILNVEEEETKETEGGKIISIDNSTSIKIWHLSLENSEITLNIKDIGRFQFNKVL